MLFVDYHFHPNLPDGAEAARERAKRIWDAFERVGLDGVIITEHAFKNPERAYSVLRENRPAGARTEIFPGVEALTAEHIDIIAFAEEPHIYEHKPLTTKGHHDYKQLVDYIEAHEDVHGFVPHPFIPFETSLLDHAGEDFYREAVERLGGVEVHNLASVYPHSLSEKMRHPIRTLANRMKKNINLPKRYWENLKYKFLAIGSDAHSIEDIGGGAEITKREPHGREHRRRNIFHSMCNNKKPLKIIYHNHKDFIGFAKTMRAAFFEFIHKRI